MSYFKSSQYNAICDRCGFKFKSGELRKDWQGLMVCDKDFETRNQQDFIKIRPEKAIPEWTRPRPQDTFKEVCYLWESSGYAGLASAGCMQAGPSVQSYISLYTLKTGL